MFARSVLVASAVLAWALVAAGPSAAKDLRFAGYDFSVKQGRGLGPGPNDWAAGNAFVDEAGRLHLRFAPTNGRWFAAEVQSKLRLGFGTYEMEYEGPIASLDPNVVFGFFNYPTADVGPDATNEIDVEFARWGDAQNDRTLNFTVWPVKQQLAYGHRTYPFPARATRSVHRFVWSRTSVAYSSWEVRPNGSVGRKFEWTYAPPNFARRIGADPMPIHFNLWGFRGRPPVDGKPVEAIVTRFSYTPAD